MKNIFACPYCFNPLPLDFECVYCSAVFAGECRDGKYHLHRFGDSWDFCLAQNVASKKATEGAKTKPTLGGTYSEADRIHSTNVCNALQIELIKHIPTIPGTFLEFGVGHGVWHQHLLDEGWSGYILDIDEDGLWPSKDNCKSVLADGYYLPFVEDSFDAVFDRASLHHFENLEAVLNQIRRVLKLGASYITVGNPSCREDEYQDGLARNVIIMKDYGLLETYPTKCQYELAFLHVFGNFQFVPVLDNSLMKAFKNKLL